MSARCRWGRHVWTVVDRQEQPSTVEVMKAAGTPITTKGVWADQLRAITRRPVIVTRRCDICGTEEVLRV